MNSAGVDAAEDRHATGKPAGSGRSSVRRTLAWTGLWVLVFALFVASRHMPYVRGSLFVVLGAFALLLAAPDAGRRRAAVLRSSHFWEMAARAAWTTGALGTVVFVEGVLFGPSEGLEAAARGLAQAFLPSVVGCVLACASIAVLARVSTGAGAARSAATDSPASPTGESIGGSSWRRWLGRTMFVVLVAWPLVESSWLAGVLRLTDLTWPLHWPAVLVLLGVTAALRLLGGAAVWDRAASVALVGAGTVTALVGLLQALLGVAAANLAAVSSGMSFLATTCLTTLIGSALVAFPLDDRHGQRHASDGVTLATRIAWVLFPLIAIGATAIIVILTLTPMQRRL